MSLNLSSLDPIDRHTFHVGFLTQKWALIEFNIDLASLSAFENLGGKNKFRELPRSLSKKLHLLRYAYSNSALAAPFRKPALGLIDCVKEGSEFRNFCVHAITIRDAGEGLPAVVHEIKRERDALFAVEHTLGEAELINAIKEAGVIWQATTMLTFRTYRACGEPVPDELFEQLHPQLALLQSATKRSKRAFAALQELVANRGR